MGVDVQISEEIFVKFLIAVVRDGKVEIETVSVKPEKCLVLFKWVEYETR